MKICFRFLTSTSKEISLAYFLRFYVGLYILLSLSAFTQVIAQHLPLETLSIGPTMPQNMLLHLLDKKESGIYSSSSRKLKDNKLDRSILKPENLLKTENKTFQNFRPLNETNFSEFSLNSGSNLMNSASNINSISNNLDYEEEILQSKQSNRNATNFWNNEAKNSHKSHYKSSPIGNLTISNINMNIITNYSQYSSKMTGKEDKNLKYDLYSNATQYTNMSVNDVMNGRSRKLPGAIIIGVKKGGTRALLEFLGAHPQVVTSGPEVHFFDQHYHLGLEWYRKKMPLSSDHQLTMEKTPSYFISRDVPKRIYNMSPDTRLILLLRDPVTRAMSDYAQAISKRPSLPPFEGLVFRNKSRTRRHSARSKYQDKHEGFHKHDDLKKIIRKYNIYSSLNTTDRVSVAKENKPNLSDQDYTKQYINSGNDEIAKGNAEKYEKSEINERWGAIRIGRYADHLKRWLQYFPLKNIQIIQSELLITDPLSQMKKLENFLGLESFFSNTMFKIRSDRGFPCLVRENKSIHKSKTNKTGIRCLGRTKGRRHPNVNEFVLEKLREYFSPKNRQLYELINRDLGWT